MDMIVLRQLRWVMKMSNVQIQSITFTSPKCFFCENPWEYRLHVETIDENNELTGETVEIRLCEECRKTKTKLYEDRIRYSLHRKEIDE